MESLTILIPTIGRKSIINTISSIDYKCKIIVAATGYELEDFDKETLSDLKYLESIGAIQLVLFTKRLTAGGTKELLIKHVDTDFFTILDDDDRYYPGYLDSAMDYLSNNPNCKWITPHWMTDDFYQVPANRTFFPYISDDMKYTDLFDYDDYSDDPDIRLLNLYPNGAMICHTRSYLALTNPGCHYHECSTLDDLIPAASMVLNYEGADAKFYCINCGQTVGSVSRRPYTYEEVSCIMEDLTKNAMLSKSEIHRDFWIKCYHNSLKRLPLYEG